MTLYVNPSTYLTPILSYENTFKLNIYYSNKQSTILTFT